MVHHQWLAALDVIWHIYSHLYSSSRDASRDLLSSKEATLTMGQVPCEFWADRPTFIFQPAAPDVIWHIYSGQCCFKGVEGIDLPSSGNVALTMGQVPCEFWADRPTFIFQPVAPDVSWHIYSDQCCFKGVLVMDLLSSGDVVLTMGQVPCEFWGDRPNLIFQPVAPDMIWHIYSGQRLLQGGWRYGPAILRGCCPDHGADPLWVLSRSANIHFSASGSWCDLAHLL